MVDRKKENGKKINSEENFKAEHGVSEMLKKLVTSGLNAAGPIAGPIEELVKDVVRDALSNVKATKEEIIGSVRKGVSDSISKIDPAQELKKILEDYNIKVEANFSFTKKDK